ncbi:MAG TPA: hypothetical protein VIJ12_02590 [Candidatus Baltobacteraceae bacterium]
MKITALVARILLGLIFGVLGFNGFLMFLPAPPPVGLGGQFLTVMYASHYAYMTTSVQIIAGLMLLSNQYVPLALVVLGAVLVNILTYHITMLPGGLPLALFVTLLWVLACLPYRAHFALLFARKVH